MFYMMETRKTKGLAILILDKIDFKPKRVRRDKEDHFILMRGTIYQEDISILNIVPKNVYPISKTNEFFF